MKLFLMIINLIALLLSVSWLSFNFCWSSVITMLVLLSTIFAQFIPSVIIKNNKDKELAESFLKEFPSTCESCRLLKSQDLHSPFRLSALNEIERFIDSWNNTSHEFIKNKLEKQKKLLLDESKKFLTNLGEKTISVSGNVDLVTTKLQEIDKIPESVKNKDWDEVEQLNKLATSIYNIHQKLTRNLRKFLNK